MKRIIFLLLGLIAFSSLNFGGDVQTINLSPNLSPCGHALFYYNKYKDKTGCLINGTWSHPKEPKVCRCPQNTKYGDCIATGNYPCQGPKCITLGSGSCSGKECVNWKGQHDKYDSYYGCRDVCVGQGCYPSY